YGGVTGRSGERIFRGCGLDGKPLPAAPRRPQKLLVTPPRGVTDALGDKQPSDWCSPSRVPEAPGNAGLRSNIRGSAPCLGSAASASALQGPHRELLIAGWLADDELDLVADGCAIPGTGCMAGRGDRA